MPLPLTPSPTPTQEAAETQLLETTCATEPSRETLDAVDPMSWQRDNEHDSIREIDYDVGDLENDLVVEPTHLSNTGAYYCATADDVAELIEQSDQGDCFVYFASYHKFLM